VNTLAVLTNDGHHDHRTAGSLRERDSVREREGEREQVNSGRGGMTPRFRRSARKNGLQEDTRREDGEE
jgi:hypothetical protein